MKIQEAIDQLISLKLHCKCMDDGEEDIWTYDVQALKYGIYALEILKNMGYKGFVPVEKEPTSATTEISSKEINN